MFGITKNANAQKKREDGEKPFWISFSDLMSSLMVLFLISMTVALLAVTNEPDIAAKEEAERSKAIKDFMAEIEQILTAQEFSGVRVDGTTIDFGVRGTFEKEGQNTLSQQQSQMLRSFTSKLLERLRTTEAGKIWFKHAEVDGYASKTGTYLFNLNLSLERSQRVLCELLREPSNPSERSFSLDDRKLIATKFFVGGASFNSLRSGGGAPSRRIEFKLEFRTLQEKRTEESKPAPKLDDAELSNALNPKEKCPIFDHSMSSNIS
jgi:outer membrane protein OmpA-like peptidoglycan-associated protein